VTAIALLPGAMYVWGFEHTVGGRWGIQLADRVARFFGSFAIFRGYGLAGQAGVSNPPSPLVSGALPTSLGIRPEIGPPFAAEAGVVSVWLAPSSAVPTQRRGVMPWTCAVAGLAGSSAIPLATASATITALDRLREVLPPTIPIDLLSGLVPVIASPTVRQMTSK
jgi:hypothetical protein